MALTGSQNLGLEYPDFASDLHGYADRVEFDNRVIKILNKIDSLLAPRCTIFMCTGSTGDRTAFTDYLGSEVATENRIIDSVCAWGQSSGSSTPGHGTSFDVSQIELGDSSGSNNPIITNGFVSCSLGMFVPVKYDTINAYQGTTISGTFISQKWTPWEKNRVLVGCIDHIVGTGHLGFVIQVNWHVSGTDS